MKLDLGAVIMAGGAGSRLGALGRSTAKCLLPLAGGQTLLSRLIGQLRSAGVPRVTVCCSPENHPQIREALGSANDLADASMAVKTVACADCAHGPLPALAEALGHVEGKWRLVCLADVHFELNPFCAFLEQDPESCAVDGCVLTGTDEMAREGAGSGAVTCKGSIVQAISYRLKEAMTAGSEELQLRRWTGSFFFRESLATDLQSRRFDYRRAPLETWIQGVLDRGAVCHWREAGHFVNVNSPEDYAFLSRREMAPMPSRLQTNSCSTTPQ